MLLGEPSVYTMTAKIQPIFELQMAPRHYDVVNGTSIDVFTKQVSSPMYGIYKTQADCTENDEVSSTETKSSETTMGVSVKASAKAGKEGGKVSGSASAGYSYTNTQKESNTQTNKYTATSSVSAAGMYDDFVSYQTEEIDVYRYPIIYPLDDDYGRDGSYAASDDVFGTDGDMTVYPSQRYLQIQVPQQPEQYTVSGLNAEWYDPVHQPYNLFTYPRELKEVKNYSSCVGETTKTNVVIGEANSSSVSVKLSEMTGETDTSSTTNKNSFNAELGVGIGQSNAAGKTPVSVSASFSYDETNSESSSSSSNLTNTAAYTLSWPGQKGYDGVYTQDEMDKASFGAALAMLVENTGNFVMAQMITDIKKTSSSSVWYQNGNYNANPDPALNLPHRLNSSTYTYRTATADDDTPRIMRGVTIYNGQESTGTTLSSSNTSYRALMADDGLHRQGARLQLQLRRYDGREGRALLDERMEGRERTDGGRQSWHERPLRDQGLAVDGRFEHQGDRCRVEREQKAQRSQGRDGRDAHRLPAREGHPQRRRDPQRQQLGLRAHGADRPRRVRGNGRVVGLFGEACGVKVVVSLRPAAGNG